MKKVFLLLSLFAVSGCLSTKPVMAPDGRQGFMISCSGAIYGAGACYEEAAKACPTGYDIIDKERQTVVYGSGGGPNVFGTVNNSNSDMLIVCKTDRLPPSAVRQKVNWQF